MRSGYAQIRACWPGWGCKYIATVAVISRPAAAGGPPGAFSNVPTGARTGFCAVFHGMNAASAAAAPITLYQQRYIRRQRGKTVVHLVPAVVLLSGVLEVATGAEPLSWLRVVEFVVGAAYLLLMARELRHLRHQSRAHPQHEPVAWLELAAAGILALEGYHLWHRHHEAALASGSTRFHVLPWLYGGVAVFYVGLAFGLRHLLERRFLHLHPAGFRGRVGLLGPAFSYEWADVRAAEPAGPADLVVVHHDGQRRRISFAGLHDGPARRDQLLAHVQAALLPMPGQA